MNQKKYKSYLIDGQRAARNWMILAFILAISNVLIVYKLVTISIDQKTIIHPVSLQSSYEIDAQHSDPEYVKALAEAFLYARFQYTPETVKAQFTNIAKYFHPAVYGKKQASLATESRGIQKDDVTSVFFPMQTHVKQTTAFVQAQVSQFLGGKEVKQQLKTIEVEFKNSGGRLWLVDWYDVEYDRINKVYQRKEVEVE